VEGGAGSWRRGRRSARKLHALKILPAAVAGDAERLARVQREAEVLAALNHPNIAAIYGQAASRIDRRRLSGVILCGE